MKKLLVILLFPLLTFGQKNDCDFQKYSIDFLEFNAGVLLLDNEYNPMSGSIGILFGSTFYVKKRLFFDIEFGVSLPSILTAKFGIGTILGKKFKISTGVRPYPSFYYLQFSPYIGDKGELITSFEISPLGLNTDPNTYGQGKASNNKIHYLLSFNIGYRFIINKK